MKLSLFTLLALILVSCGGSTNFLVGKWEFDGDRTLSELRNRKDAPEKLVKCYERKACGYDTVFTYTETGWSQYFKFSPEDVSGPIEYKYETVAKDTYRITTVSNGNPVIYTMYFENGRTAYINMDHDGYTWKEYLVKIP